MTTSQADINTNANNSTKSAAAAVGGGDGAASLHNSAGDDSNGSGLGLGNRLSTMTLINNSNNAAPAADMGKRKKLKSRNTNTVPTPGGGGYAKDHLDAWLETCLKDACTTQYSSSSEFLDYNPTSAVTATQQQQQHQPQQLQQQSAFNMSNLNQSQQQQQPQQQQQQQFAMRTYPNTNTNLPNSNSSFNNFPFSQGFQRNTLNFMKPPTTNPMSNMVYTPMSVGSGSVGSGGFYVANDGSQDFASLPPMVNILGGGGGNTSEQENISAEVMNSSANRGFRFSDPCLLNPSDSDFKGSGQNTPDRRNDTEPDQKTVFNILMEQIQHLNETNAKICRDLHEAKVCIEVLKHAPHLGMRHRRDSISGLSTHSQPMVFGSGFGTHSPAPSFHSGAYTPGIMTDVVREVKDAARVREDALLSRVKSLVEERQWSMNESNLRMMRDIEELKSIVHHLRVDRKESNKRLNHLEAENKYMRQMLAALYNNRTVPDIIYENETLRTRKHFPNVRRNQVPLNIHFGTVHHQAASSSLEEHEEHPLHIVETPSTASTADIGVLTSQEPDMRHSFSSSDGGGSLNGGLGSSNISVKVGPTMSPPNFALISAPNDEIKRKKGKAPAKLPSEELELTSSTQELRRELNEAVAARKEADDRIIALEKLVKTLQVNSTHPPSTSSMATTTTTIENQTTPRTTTTITTKSPTRQHSPSPKHQQLQMHPISNGDGIGGQQQKTKLVAPISTNSGVGSLNRPMNRRSIPTTASRSKWLNNQNLQQQQQQQQQSVTSVHNIPVKLSVAGPVTDL